MADKPVKKITKTINGTDYGLQVESAIRDGQGNVISDTYQKKGESGESNQWIEFGAANQVVPSSSLVVGGIFFEEQ